MGSGSLLVVQAAEVLYLVCRAVGFPAFLSRVSPESTLPAGYPGLLVGPFGAPRLSDI